MAKLRNWWIGIAAALPLAVLFGPALLSDRSFAMRDAGHFYLPLFQWTTSEFASGCLPLWNPQENGGISVVADASSSVFYPAKLLFAAPLDIVWLYKLYIVLHLALAALGAFVAARLWRASPQAAALAATAYAAGGSVAFQHCNVVFLVGAAWLPWAFIALDRLMASRKPIHALSLAAVLAMMILGGDPQMAYHMLLLGGLYVAVQWKASSQQTTARPFVQAALLVFAAGAAFLLSAVQILPSSEATPSSERAAYDLPRNLYEAIHVGSADRPANDERPEPPTRAIARGLLGVPVRGTHHEQAYDFSIGPWRLAELIWPNVGGRMFPENRRWMSHIPAEGRVWTPTLYMSLLAVVLGLSQFRLVQAEPRVRWLSWTLLLFLLGSFGWYGIGWLVREIYGTLLGGESSELSIGHPIGGVYWLMVTLLPKYIYFRYPAKLFVVAALVLSLLAARGYDRAFDEQAPRLRRFLAGLAIVSLLAAAIAWFAFPLQWARALPADAWLGPFEAHGARWDVVFALLHAAVVSFIACVLLRLSTTGTSTRWKSLALLLVAVDLSVANAWIVPIAPADIWREPGTLAAAIQSDHRAHEASEPSTNGPRLYRNPSGSWRPISFKTHASQHRLAETCRWERNTLFPKYQLFPGLSLVESSSSIKSHDYRQIWDVARWHGPHHQQVPHPNVLRLIGTEYLVVPSGTQVDFARPITLESPAAVDLDAALWRIQYPLSRARIVHQIEALPPLDAPHNISAVRRRTEEILFPDGKPRDFAFTAVVETEDASILAEVRPVSLAHQERCEITLDASQQVRIAADLQQAGLLVLADAYAPGWKAYIRQPTERGIALSETAAWQETPILRTNRAFRGVFLPAGAQQVEFRYEPTSFYYGAALSSAAWLALVATAVIYWRRSFVANRRSSENSLK